MTTYDYIVIGTGSAGSVVAERLSASGRNSVLVLEAGGSDRRFHVQMPLGYAQCFTNPEVNWNFRTEPDPGLANRVSHWPRGKVLGGSSSINALVWIRGHRTDFDDWRAAGNVGWGYDDVLPAFKALEDNAAGADEWRAAGGPVRVSDITKFVHPLAMRFIEAGCELGLPRNLDFNGADQEGMGIYQQNISKGRRVSAARAYLHPASKRPNVRVETHAVATRILIEQGRAVGVDYLHKGKPASARARREVIISAGSINSPHLLQLSGIGPGRLLAETGIETLIANDNVGAHLQDHQSVNYAWRSRIPTLNRLLRPWWGKAYIGSRYLLTRTGPLAMSLNQGGGFLRTDPALTRPNMQIYFQASSTVPPRPGERAVREIDPWPGFAMGISNCRPKSRGEIRLASRDPLAAPRITANALSHDDDVAEMLEGVRFLRRMAATKAMAPFIVEEVRPGSSLQSNDELVADIRSRAGTVFHPVSTCRMAPDAADGVVSPRLKVHGVNGLRVIDASVFPNIISGNTNAAAMMIGWKGAEMILEDNA
ncbi:GMC family oxidoreductase [Arvimicrobium flavum]|uniref:GMC family oxidoreductase n=1 Tax=Arvimicrobium flavum TaxID=3393320 RepID=UPI00237A1A46|nr:GMC family oxidoreductase N-terminal domain-containing protein [Mesorhizobium shangrilense]